MTDIVKLRELLADPAYENKTPDEILAALTEPSVEPEPPAEGGAASISIAQAEGLGEVSPADIFEALNPPTSKRSHPEIPGSYFINPSAESVSVAGVDVPRFGVLFDDKLAEAQPDFDSEAAAQAWVDEYYAARPPIEVPADGG